MGMQIQIHLMAHTRSKSFDYAWLHCLEDQALQGDLNRFVVPWLSNTHLDSLPPVLAFFIFKEKGVLFSGRKSPTRCDDTDREIFERVLFVWDVKKELRYSHLDPLRHRLERESQDIFASVPDDLLRAPRGRSKSISVELEDLDFEAGREQESDDDWNLPLQLQWEEVVTGGLTLEVPADWPFRRIVAPLRNRVIRSGEAVFIGCGVPFRLIGDAGGSWVVSGPVSDKGRLPRARDSSGNILDQTAVKRLLRSRRADGTESKAKLAEKSQPAERTRTDENGVWKSDSETLPDFQDAADLSREIERQAKRGDRWGLRRHSAHDTIPTAVKRLYFLISPAGRLIGTEVLASWYMLLFEILLFHGSDLSAGMVDEWMRRLSNLKQIAANWQIKVPPDWFRQLDDSYRSLQYLLSELRPKG